MLVPLQTAPTTPMTDGNPKANTAVGQRDKASLVPDSIFASLRYVDEAGSEKTQTHTLSGFAPPSKSATYGTCHLDVKDLLVARPVFQPTPRPTFDAL